MEKEGPLDDVSGLMSQVRAVSWRDSIQLQEQGLVSPENHEAEDEAGEVQHRDGRTEHHDDPDHGNQL